jgi:F-type H+-transporting ATPase subunit b
MKIRSAWFRISLLAVASGGAAFAAEEHAEHAAHAAPGIETLFFPVVNFAIFAYVIARYAWPALRGGLAERKKVVEKELAEGDRARKEAQAMVAEIEARRAGLAAEGERLVREMRGEAEHERDALVNAARQTADRIRADAKLLGDQEADRAAHAIREEVAAKVLARVATALRERVKPEDEARFVDEFVATVEQTGRMQ